jgi:hypothetical protein
VGYQAVDVAHERVPFIGWNRQRPGHRIDRSPQVWELLSDIVALIDANKETRAITVVKDPVLDSLQGFGALVCMHAVV